MPVYCQKVHSRSFEDHNLCHPLRHVYTVLRSCKYKILYFTSKAQLQVFLVPATVHVFTAYFMICLVIGRIVVFCRRNGKFAGSPIYCKFDKNLKFSPFFKNSSDF